MAATRDPCKTVLITGASTGIGYELAKLFARDGYHMILVSRDKARLEAVRSELQSLAPCEVTVVPRDLVIPRAPDEIFEELQQNAVEVDMLVNNAGVGAHGAFHKTDTQRLLDLVALNVTALTHLTRLFLPGMIARGYGRVLNVASTAAYLPGPYMATYYASKGFVLSLSDAIATELDGTGVTMTTLSPGPTETEFHKRAKVKRSPLGRSGHVTLRAAYVARIGYEAMRKGKRSVVTGLKYRFIAFMMSRVIPRSLVLKIVSMVNKNR